MNSTAVLVSGISAVLTLFAAAAPVLFDCGTATSPVQAGWTALRKASPTATQAGVTVTLSTVGAAVTLDDRDRSTANGGGAEAGMWQDFLFGNGSTATGTGFQLVISGLTAGDTYPITLWAFDKSSSGVRSADWSANDGAGGAWQDKGTLAFNGSDAAPASLNSPALTLQVVVPAGGTVTLRGVKSVVGGNASHNVYLNGIRIGDPLGPPVAPTDIALSGQSLSDGAPTGTLAGEFSTTDPQPAGPFTYALVSGEGASDNALFILGGVDGEQLLTAAPLTGRSGQAISIRVRTTDPEGHTFEKIFTLAVTPDSDNDGLDDLWERAWFPDLTVATGLGDNDGDGLNNIGEYLRGTNPKLADTDADGLSDNMETNSGTFVSAANPGSSPVTYDTDGDGLSDGEEVSSANGFVTNPNLYDTDGDGFSDSFEIQSGTNPLVAASKPAGNLPLRLNEVVAANSGGLKDGFGANADWIEIFNPNAAAVSLAGYRLTDNTAIPDKWIFPSVILPAQSYLVVFASGRNVVDAQGHLHTSFGLGSGGESLTLLRPDGTTVEDSVVIPPQFTDVSYGRVPANGAWRFYAAPTPRLANSGTAYDGVVKDTAFSVNRGFFDAPFSLAVSTATPGAVIRYTLSGEKPTETTGLIYGGPLTVNGTAVVRALASRSGWLSTNVDTQTYIFPNQVVTQPANPPGYPLTWGINSQVDANDGAGNGTVPSDYAMDPRVEAGALPGYKVRDALLDIPTMALTLPVDDFFGLSRGIWANPTATGSSWERECSIELMFPDGRKGFHENCVVEVHGNSSRNPWRMQKHSLRVTFRSSVGAGKLTYKIFPDSPLDSWNKLVLRGCFTDGWGLVSWGNTRYRPNDSQYLRDVWMKDVYKEMGQPSTYGNYVHLYMDGHYLGIYNPTERFDFRYLIDRFGGTGVGDAEGWEINDDLSTPGTRWNQLMAAPTWAQVLTFLDAENFADYMLLHFFAEAEDWPHHNGYAATNSALGFPYRFFVWDQEIALDNHSIERIDTSTGAGALFQRMRTFPEFRLLFADRARKHLFNGGALTVAKAGATYMKRATEIDKAIVAESARWGDTRSSLPYGNPIEQPVPLTNADHLQYPPAPNGPNFYFTREQSWLVERDNILTNHLPSLHNTANSYATINRLRSKNLYPTTNPPAYSQHGGVVAGGYALGMTHANAAGTVYYTLDGSDPRDPATGNPAGPAYSAAVGLTTSATVKSRVRNGTVWSALTEAFFIVGVPASATNTALTEINYQPAVNSLEEFVEIQNFSAGGIDLSGVRFTQGIAFTFPDAFTLAPGERAVVVRDSAAFTARYGATPRVAGVFTGALDNNGETLTLLAADDSVIVSFRYNDAGNWPGAAAGGGSSLTLRSVGLDPALPASWRASNPAGGTPGSADSLTFSGDPAADADGNGLADILDYAISSLPVATVANPAAWLVTFDRVNAADGAILNMQTSTDLTDWTEAPLSARVAVDPSGAGIVRESWVFTPPASGRLYVRLAAQVR